MSYFKFKKQLFISVSIVALTALSGFVIGAEREISPVITHYGTGTNGTAIGAESNPIIVTVSNNAATNMTIAAFALQGDSTQFNKAADNCSGATVTAGNTCTFQVTYKPTQLGSRLAYASLVTTVGGVDETLTAFFSNDEDDKTQAQRRLPAVVNSIKFYAGNDNTGPIINTSATALTAGQEYTVWWLILGYGDSYQSRAVVYSCTALEVSNETCAGGGAGTGDLVHDSIDDDVDESVAFGSIGSDLSETSFLGVDAYLYAFKTTFTAPVDNTKVLGVRFFSRADNDIFAGGELLSVLMPGNLSRIGGTTSGYVGTAGRRLFFNLQ